VHPRIFILFILYGSCVNIFVYTIDGLELYSIYKNRYFTFYAYTRPMDGGIPWVIITYVRRTPHEILFILYSTQHYIIYYYLCCIMDIDTHHGRLCHHGSTYSGFSPPHIIYLHRRELTVLGTHTQLAYGSHHTGNCHYPSPPHRISPRHVREHRQCIYLY